MIKFDKKAFEKISKDVFTCDSPSGYTANAVKVVSKYLDEFGCDYKIMNNGAIEVSKKGLDSSKLVATSAHLDTLGLMVRSVKTNGALALTTLGGPVTPSLDGEYCKIYTRSGKVYTGTIQST